MPRRACSRWRGDLGRLTGGPDKTVAHRPRQWLLGSQPQARAHARRSRQCHRRHLPGAGRLVVADFKDPIKRCQLPCRGGHGLGKGCLNFLSVISRIGFHKPYAGNSHSIFPLHDKAVLIPGDFEDNPDVATYNCADMSIPSDGYASRACRPAPKRQFLVCLRLFPTTETAASAWWIAPQSNFQLAQAFDLLAPSTPHAFSIYLSRSASVWPCVQARYTPRCAVVLPQGKL